MKWISHTLVLFLLPACGVSFDPPAKPKTGLEAIGTIAGTWKATNVTDTIGASTRSCESGTIVIEKNAIPGSVDAAVTIKQRRFSCANKTYQTDWNEITLNQHESKLSIQGTNVGEMTDSFLQIEYGVASGTTWKISLFQTGETFRYQESMTGSSSTVATLEKQ